MIQNRCFAKAFVILIATGVIGVLVAHRPTPVVVATNLEKIPIVIDEYRGVEDTFPESVYKELNADKNVYRHYRAADGSVMDLYIGYYGTAKGGRTGHNPYACLPGAGAAIVETGQIYVENSNAVVPVNYILSRKDGANTVMLHWYQTAGSKVVSSGFAQNVQRFVGKAINNRNDGAFVRITSTTEEKDISITKAKATAFAKKILKVLPLNWPVES